MVQTVFLLHVFSQLYALETVVSHAAGGSRGVQLGQKSLQKGVRGAGAAERQEKEMVDAGHFTLDIGRGRLAEEIELLQLFDHRLQKRAVDRLRRRHAHAHDVRVFRRALQIVGS